MRQTVYSKCKYPTKHNRNHLKSQKAVILFIPESPHLTGIFKGSQMLQQNSEYIARSNAERITKSFCLRCWPEIWHKSQMPNWEGLTLGQIPLCLEQNTSMGMPWWGSGGGVGDKRLWNWLVNLPSYQLLKRQFNLCLANNQKTKRNKLNLVKILIK